MANKLYVENDAMIWVQPDGINTVCKVLDCHDLADLVIPKGDVERSFCVDPETGGYRLGTRKQGPPGAPTTTVTAHVANVRDWLERVQDCPTTFYVHKVPCGSRKLFLNFERSWTLRYAMVTQQTLSNMATLMSLTGAPTDSAQAFDLDLDVVNPTMNLEQSRQVTAEDAGALDVAFCNVKVCHGYCGPAKEICAEGMIVYSAALGAIANVEYTLDGGTTWTSAIGPFLADEDISSVVCFPVGDGTTTRHVVSRGTIGAAGAEVSWTDDYGATWNDVTAGAVANEFIPWNGGLFALDDRHIWMVTEEGDIWFSQDGALSWTEQAPGTTTLSLKYVRFVDPLNGIIVGETNTILITRDGGQHWNVVTGPAAGGNLLCCEIFDRKRAWIGDDTGSMFYTDNLGVGMVAGDWAERLLDLPTGAVSQNAINDCMWVRESGVSTDDHCGYLVTKWTEDANIHGAIYRTINGGYDWTIWFTGAMDSDSPLGLHAVWACGQNQAFAVGDPLDATAYIMEVSSPI